MWRAIAVAALWISLSSACDVVIYRRGCIWGCRVQKITGNKVLAPTQQTDNFQIDETEMLHLYALLDSQGTILLVTLRQPPFQISTTWLVWSKHTERALCHEGAKGPFYVCSSHLPSVDFLETMKRSIAQFNTLSDASLLEESVWPGMLGGVKEESTTKDLPQMFRDVCFIQYHVCICTFILWIVCNEGTELW